MAALTIFIAAVVAFGAAKELTYYLDVERINVTYVNQKYYSFLNATARRFGRWDPIHYVHIHGETLVSFGNNATVDVFVYEFLSNEYRRGFVEMHYKVCDLLQKDTVFGPFVTKNLPKVCPIPKAGSQIVVNKYAKFKGNDPIIHKLSEPHGYFKKACTGPYHLVNISVPDLPLLKTFPFVKGRVYANTTITHSHERIVEGYVDVVIKQRWS